MSKRVVKTAVFLLLIPVLIVSTWAMLGKKDGKGEQFIVGCPVPRASAYGQNGERGFKI